jgi:hypothetical protein
MRVTPTTWRGLPAWLLADSGREVVVMRHGASLACLRLAGEDGNPLWQPAWPASATPDPQLHGDPRGEGGLLATAVGSLLCLDRFGPPRRGEDRPFHGEAAHAIWDLEAVEATTACFTTQLPRSGLALHRRISLDGGICRLATSATSPHDAHDIEWCEHLTLGDPFLSGAIITAGIDRIDPPGDPDSAPVATDPSRIAALLAMPHSAAAPRSDLFSGRVAGANGWWCAENPMWQRRLTVTWLADDFPWLAVWTEHRHRTGAPWLGRERAKGLELSTKPYPADHAYPAPERLGRPAQCHLPAGVPVTRTVTLAWEAR